MLEVGMKAPNFTVLSDENKEVSLSDYLGQKVILYFYPKDNTPGCTVEANQFNEALEKLTAAGYVVLGVSRDTVKRHCSFKEKYDLKFPLLADTDEVVCNLYHVLQEKKNYGKTYIGIVRSTFVIDEEGNLAKVYYNVKAKEHVEKLLNDLAI